MRRVATVLLVLTVVAGAGYGGYWYRQHHHHRPVTVVTNCASNDFTAQWQSGGASASTVYAWIRMTKVTRGSCRIGGWPQLRYVGGGTYLHAAFTRIQSAGELQDWNGIPTPFVAVSDHLVSRGQKVDVALSYPSNLSCAAVSEVELRWTSGSVTVSPELLMDQCAGEAGLISPFFFR